MILFSYIDADITIMSCLVAALICWNIFSLVDIRSHKKELQRETARLESLIADMNAQSTLNKAVVEQSLSDLYLSAITGKGVLDEYNYIRHSVFAIVHLSQVGDFETAGVVAESVVKTLVRPEQVILTQGLKEQLLVALSGTVSAEKVRGFATVVSLVSRTGTRQSAP